MSQVRCLHCDIHLLSSSKSSIRVHAWGTAHCRLDDPHILRCHLYSLWSHALSLSIYQGPICSFTGCNLTAHPSFCFVPHSGLVLMYFLRALQLCSLTGGYDLSYRRGKLPVSRQSHYSNMALWYDTFFSRWSSGMELILFRYGNEKKFGKPTNNNSNSKPLSMQIVTKR